MLRYRQGDTAQYRAVAGVTAAESRARNSSPDLGRPTGGTTQRAIKGAKDRYALCVRPAQHLEDEEQIVPVTKLDTLSDLGTRKFPSGSKPTGRTLIFDHDLAVPTFARRPGPGRTRSLSK
jgi:hypothetical protein